MITRRLMRTMYHDVIRIRRRRGRHEDGVDGDLFSPTLNNYHTLRDKLITFIPRDSGWGVVLRDSGGSLRDNGMLNQTPFPLIAFVVGPLRYCCFFMFCSETLSCTHKEEELFCARCERVIFYCDVFKWIPANGCITVEEGAFWVQDSLPFRTLN